MFLVPVTCPCPMPFLLPLLPALPLLLGVSHCPLSSFCYFRDVFQSPTVAVSLLHLCCKTSLFFYKSHWNKQEICESPNQDFWRTLEFFFLGGGKVFATLVRSHFHDNIMLPGEPLKVTVNLYILQSRDSSF